MKQNNFWVFTILLTMALGLGACGSKERKIDNVRSKVINIKNGNTIELANGLTVHLLGVSDNAQSQDYLKTKVLNREVSLKADQSSSKKKSYKRAKDHVWAYVTLRADGKAIPLNGQMIREKICKVNTSFLGDSLNAFTKIPDLPSMMDYPALKAKTVPATFMVRAGNEEATWLGTGFFISPNGLALTNNHVLSGSEVMAYVSMPNSEGRIDGTRNRRISKLIYTDPNLDYSIFQVSLDPGETVPCLEVASTQAVVPDEIGVVGNPLGFDALFTTGTVSQIFKEAGKIGVTADITSGNSGGPICNKRGQVIGISQSVAVAEAGDAPKFGVDIMHVRKVLDSHSDIPTYAGK